MAYSRGFLKRRVSLYNRKDSVNGEFGREAGEYEPDGKVWANITWDRGIRALRQLSVDNYQVIMLRTDWTERIRRGTRVKVDGILYECESPHGSKSEDVLQVTCIELQTD